MRDVVNSIFTHKGMREALFKARFLLVFLLLPPLAYLMNPDHLLPAAIVSLFGQAIQTWCFATLIKNRELTTRGPYRISRNPMYLGRFFLILGFLLLLDGTTRVVAVVAYTVLYWLYMSARVGREERRLKRVFTDAYAEYCRKVNRFWPTLRPIFQRETWTLDVKAFFENNAHWNILGTLTAYVVLYLIRPLFV